MRWNRRPVCPFALLFGLAGACVGVGAVDGPIELKPAQVEALGLKTQSVEVDAVRAAARYPAIVSIPASQQRVVATALPGMVESLRVSVGDAVRAGQVLAVLRSAQAQELQHDVHVSRSQAALAASQLSRDEQLFKEGLIAASRLENTRNQAGLAQEQRDERALALSQAGGSAHDESSRITLTAPISGVVLERPVVVGQRLDTAGIVYRLAQLSPLWLEMQVPATQATGVSAGDTVSVAGSDAKARVILVGHAVDPASQTVLVRAEVKQPPASLRAGQAVEALLERNVPGLSRVPSAAMVEDAGVTLVFVDAGGGRFRALPIESVSTASGFSAVRGIPAGSKVVVQGTAALKALRAARRP
jgi:RND family efflux transporter MFP subunit